MKKDTMRDMSKRKIDLLILIFILVSLSIIVTICTKKKSNIVLNNSTENYITETAIVESTFLSEPEEIMVSNQIVELSIDDAQLLMKLAWSEAGNQGIEGQLAIMNVVMNRVNDENFPDTVKDVIYQKCGNYYQFSVVGNGVLKKAEPTEETQLSLAELEGGKDVSQGALYFEAISSSSKSWHRKSREFLFEDYGQRFYK